MTGYSDDYDECKVFISRIPEKIGTDRLKQILQNLVEDDGEVEVALLAPREDKDNDEDDDDKSDNKDDKNERKHRGCAFVTFPSAEVCQKAIDKGFVKAGAAENAKRKYKMYIRAVVRGDQENINSTEEKVCYLWEQKGKCPYGEECKFSHPIDKKGKETSSYESQPTDEERKSKIPKCFNFRKKGSCKNGDACPFRHVAPNKEQLEERLPKHCINWKTKGKCRTKECPFRHDEEIRSKLLAKKKEQAKKEPKCKQPLWCRVFGMCFSTTAEHIRALFEPFGKIDRIDFPTFEDSGRSKGYCGILFTSPKAVQSAIEKLNGTELHGRWLSVQEGKMMLKQWERREDEARKEKKQEGETRKHKNAPTVGEFGQKVKKRKKHGFEESS